MSETLSTPADPTQPEPGDPEFPSAASPPSGCSETFDLVQRAQAGDARALERLARRYYPRIRRMISIRAGAALRSRVELDDLVQNVLLRILGGLESFERRSDALFIHWVSRLASNELGQQARRAGVGPPPAPRDSQLLEQLRDHTRDALERLCDNDAEQLVDRCIRELSRDHQEILLLRDYAGASWSEVEQELDRPSLGACQQLHQRAIKALEKRLRQSGLA